MLQVVWLIVTLIVRAARGLPSSQLELLVAAFSGCSFLIYLLFWGKPKDVGAARCVSAARYPTAEEILKVALEGPSTVFHYRVGYWIPNNAVHRMSSKTPELQGPPGGEELENVNDEFDFQPRLVFIIGGAIGAVVFGAPHLAGWFFTFPTPVEQLLWRIAALMSVGLPVIGVIVDSGYGVLYQQFGRRKRENASLPGAYQKRYLQRVSKLIWLFALPYLVGRLYIVVEVFRCLCYLPPEAYLSIWAASVPHLG